MYEFQAPEQQRAQEEVESVIAIFHLCRCRCVHTPAIAVLYFVSSSACTRILNFDLRVQAKVISVGNEHTYRENIDDCAGTMQSSLEQTSEVG